MIKDANHLILIAGLARKLKITPNQLAEMLEKDGEKNRKFWNDSVEERKKIRYETKKS